MQNKQHESMISALQAGEVTTNRILDINTMMTAFQDYIDKAIAGEAGVPINYYLKPITKLMIAQMYVLMTVSLARSLSPLLSRSPANSRTRGVGGGSLPSSLPPSPHHPVAPWLPLSLRHSPPHSRAPSITRTRWMNQYCGTKFMGGDDREDEDEEEGGEEGDEEGGEEDAPADDAE